MTEKEENRNNQAREEALAQMAEEVPPMPADFHEKWTKAVRAEAANTENEAKTKSEPEKDNNNRIILINRWICSLTSSDGPCRNCCRLPKHWESRSASKTSGTGSTRRNGFCLSKWNSPPMRSGSAMTPGMPI